MDTFERYFNSSLRFLSFRQRSEKEVRDNLTRKIRHSGKRSASRIRSEELDSGVLHADALSPQNDDKIIDQVIDKLKEKKFINDEEFAKWWIESRTRFRPRSLKLIAFELKQKGIAQDLIESGIRNQELGIKDDASMARKLVEKKIGKYKGVSKQELYQKLGSFLVRRGFNWETIKQAIDEANA